MFRTMLVEDSPSLRQIVKENLHDQFPSMDMIEAVDGAGEWVSGLGGRMGVRPTLYTTRLLLLTAPDFAPPAKACR